MKVLAFLFCMIIPLMAFSQSGSGTAKLDRMKEDDYFITRLLHFIPAKEIFRYGEFQDGRVYSKPHKESNVTKLNYNLLLRDMVMIAENRDTIFVANFEIIKYILIGKDLYYHDYKKGYYELLSDPDDSVRLATQRWIDVRVRDALNDVEKPQLDSYKNYFKVLYHPLNQTLPDEVVKLAREVSFFLIDQHEEIHPATKSAFIKVFPKHKHRIEDYLKQLDQLNENIKFHKEDDLKKLLQFCLSLG